MARDVDALLKAIRSHPDGVRLADALKVAEHYFGPPRRSGSHHVFKVRWPGDPRVNLQEAQNGKAKAYQVRQLLQAIDKLASLPQRKE